MAILAGKDLTSKGFVEKLSEDTLCECHAVAPVARPMKVKLSYLDNHAHHLHIILLSLPPPQLHGPSGILSHENDHGSGEHGGLSFFLSPEDTIDVGESHSLPTPGSGTSSEHTPGPSRSQPHSPISVFYQTTGILPHPPTTTTSHTSKAVSRGKRFPWTSYNNFGFSSDSDDEIDVAARPRTADLLALPSITSATTSQSPGEASPRLPRIVSDPHDVSYFSRAANTRSQQA